MACQRKLGEACCNVCKFQIRQVRVHTKMGPNDKQNCLERDFKSQNSIADLKGPKERYMCVVVVVVVVLLFNVHGKQLWSCRDGQLT